MFSLQLTPLARQCLFVIAAALSTIGAGIPVSWSSPVLVMLSDTNATILARTVTEEETTWLASVLFATCPISAIVGPMLVDCLGRKKTLLLAYIPKMAACLLYIFATDVWQLILARIIDGFSIMGVLISISTYSAEIADKNTRGALGSLIQIFTSLGVVAVMVIGPYLSYMTFHLAYAVTMVLSFLPIWLLPESPYFLYSKGKIEESIKILNSIRKTEEETREELLMYAETEKFTRTRLRQALRNKSFLKPFGIVCFLGMCSQLSGYNFVSLYFQTTVQSTNTVQPELASTIFGLVQLVSCCLPTLITDRVGRKPILCVTTLIIGLGMAGLGSFFWWQASGREVTPFLKYLPLLAMVAINIGYSAGFGAIYFVILPELFDGPERALGVTIGLVSLSISTFALSKSYSAILNSMGAAATYWMFSLNCVLFCLFVAFLIPETKGKMFREIQAEFGSKGGKEDEC